MALSRRRFVQGAAITAGFVGLGRYTWAQGFGRAEPQPYLNEVDGYGPLVPDPKRILDLPEGFSYTVLSRAGDVMDDGFRVPGLPDGMAAFSGPDGRVILVRNHEMTKEGTLDGAFGVENELFARLDRGQVYDAGYGRPHLGGTTTIVYDPETRTVERQFLSLAGTLRNCAGGPTPWGTWITCEEAVDQANENTNERHHGYAFEVPATADIGLADPVPLEGMGRFYREAVAVDPGTNIVYQTEDRGDGLIYRFIPDVPGNLAAGGRIQVLAFLDMPSADTRNWAETAAPKLPVGKPMPVRWIDIDQPDVTEDDLRVRGFEMGAARFARGEGMWWGDGEVFFACTNGGVAQRGQIFRYRPSPAEGTVGEQLDPGTLELYLEPNNVGLLESCDNVAVAPWGDLLICEDQAAQSSVVRQQGVNYLRGVTPEGRMYTIARNRYVGDSELAGSCFAPDHPTLFVNIQSAGLTLAVTGPWAERRG